MSDLPKVFATRLMPEDVEARFRSEFDAQPNETDAPLDTAAIVSVGQCCRAISCSPIVKIHAVTRL